VKTFCTGYLFSQIITNEISSVETIIKAKIKFAHFAFILFLSIAMFVMMHYFIETIVLPWNFCEFHINIQIKLEYSNLNLEKFFI